MNARWGLALFIGLPLVILIGLVLLVPRGDDLLAAPDERVVARVPSPDGRRTALVAEIAANAPTVDGVVVRVDGEEALLLGGVRTATVRWPGAKVLEVTFGHARSARIGRIDGLKVVLRGTVDPP